MARIIARFIGIFGTGDDRDERRIRSRSGSVRAQEQEPSPSPTTSLPSQNGPHDTTKRQPQRQLNNNGQAAAAARLEQPGKDETDQAMADQQIPAAHGQPAAHPSGRDIESQAVPSNVVGGGPQQSPPQREAGPRKMGSQAVQRTLPSQGNEALEALRSQNTKLVGDHERLRQEHDGLTRDYNKLCKDVDKLEDENKTLKDAARNERKNISEAKARAAETERKVRDLSAQNAHRLSRIKELEQKNDTFHADLVQSCNTIKDLHSQIKKLDEDKTKFRIEIERLIDAQSDDAQADFKVSDDAVLQKWTRLNVGIRNFVRNNFSWPPRDVKAAIISLGQIANRSAFADSLAMSLLNLPEFHESEFLLEGAMWELVNDVCLSNSRGIWGARTGYQLIQLMRSSINLNISVNTEFIDARTKLAMCIDKAVGIDIKRLNKAVMDCAHDSSQFLLPSVNQDTVVHEIKEIYMHALEICTIFAKSKAVFALVLPPHVLKSRGHDHDIRHCLFDRKTMHAELGNGESNAFVRAVISPAIIKTGNGDGENYDQTIALINSRVIVSSLVGDTASQVEYAS